MARGVDWLGLAGAAVRFRPKVSIAIAFELGMLAAEALAKSRRLRAVSNVSSTLIELVPSLVDLGGPLPNARRPRSTKTKRQKKPAGSRNSGAKKPS